LNRPDRRDLELNEAGWWSNWARLTWLSPTGYLLSSDDLKEPFFNRAGTLACTGVSRLSAAAEEKLAARGMDSTVTVFDSCVGAAEALEGSGYRTVDTMTVLLSRGPIESPNPPHTTILTRPSALRWANAYLDAFYGNRKLSSRVTPIINRLLKNRAATLLEARIKGETAGVLAIFRTKGLAGVYCVGTVPRFRRLGVAGVLLSRARAVALAEERNLVLQSLASDGSKQFYLNRGFVPLHSKQLLSKKTKMPSRAKGSRMDLGVSIERKAPLGPNPFLRVFGGFEKLNAVRDIFGARTDEVLGKLNVEIADGRGYMRISDEKASIIVNAKYLKEGKEVDVYLDVIHELVHIRQHHEGKELWDKNYKYIDRPTEIEAYRVAVNEARRLGMSEDQVAEYLRVEWIPEDEFRSFLENVGVKKPPHKER